MNHEPVLPYSVMTKYAPLIKMILQTLLLNCVATLFVILLNSAAGLTIRNTAFAVSYSFCIGSFCGLALFTVVPRVRRVNWGWRILIFALALFTAVYAGLLTGNCILYLFGFVKFNNIVPLNWQFLLFPLAIGLIFGGGAYFYESSQAKLLETEEHLRRKEIEEARAYRLAAEAQLASLESRIHPHFLFNTLNSIAALIRENPLLAEKTVEKLSALLRYSLDSNAKSLVSLEQELEITEKYLEIEKLRFERRIAYRINCEPKFYQTQIPPLSLQTLVENSIKHVAAKTSEPTEILVSVAENNQSLEIKVCDNGPGFDESAVKENHGLDILQKRLQTIFVDQARLETAGNGEVSLRLPI